MPHALGLIGSRVRRRLCMGAITLLGATGCASAAIQRPEVVITVKPPAGLARRADGVRVHLDTGDPIALEVRDGQRWESVCSAPCDKGLVAGARYRLTRQNRAVSDEFTLEAPIGSQVTIAVGPTQAFDDRPSTPWLKPTL
jgi:hypothetical protein